MPPFCVKCSRHLVNANQEGLCPDCIRHYPHFDTAWGLTRYQEPMKKLIHSFKFHDKTSLRHVFYWSAQNFLDQYPFSFEEFDALIPIPLTSTRLRERSYNQAEILAQEFSKIIGKPILTHCLQRVKHTPRQSDLSQKLRRTNILNAFSVKNSKALKGKNILLVDDLLTTGATASEAAQTLKEKGVQKVGLLVLSIA